MKAVTFNQSLPIDDERSLIDVTLEMPTPGPRDLLVEIRAIAINPLDAKIRAGGGPAHPSASASGGGPRILGWDAAGVVAAVGPGVTRFAPGDAVYYAGTVDRPGSYAQFQLVDEHLVAIKPATLDFADAAALPLTTITAWELLFDRLRVRASAGALLIVGAAGGVGSIATQLARRLTPLTVIATASRPDTQTWAREMGAHHVIDHRQPIAAPVKAIVPAGVDYILALTRTEDHFDQLVEAMAPQAAIGLIELPSTPLDFGKLRPKSISLHWEFVFTRPRFQTPDMADQGRILDQVARLVDEGHLRSTARLNLGPINATNLRRAHALIEGGHSIGKIVLAGF